MHCTVNKIGKIFQVVNKQSLSSYVCTISIENTKTNRILFYFPEDYDNNDEDDAFLIVPENRTSDNLNKNFKYTDNDIPIKIRNVIRSLGCKDLQIVKYNDWWLKLIKR